MKKRIDKKHTENIQAYQMYLQGKFYWNKRTFEDLQKAITFFERSVELDPKYALGYSGLAETYVVLGDSGTLMEDLRKKMPDSVYPKAEEYCLKALSIDSELAQTQAALGEIMCDWKWNFREAEKAYKRAIELNPNYATAYQWLGEYYSATRKFSLARESINRAKELDPFSIIISFFDGMVYGLEKKYDKAIEIFEKILEKNPDFQIAHFTLSATHLTKKSYEKALYHAEQCKSPLNRAYLKFRILASRGEVKEARKILNKLLDDPYMQKSSGLFAIMYADLGEMEEALKWYKMGIEKHSPFLLHRHSIGAKCEVLNSDPSVKEILKKHGLE